MKRRIQILSYLFLAVVLSSCVQAVTPTTLPPSAPVLTRSTPTAYPSLVTPTTEAYPSYPTSTPAAYPIPIPATLTPAAYPNPILAVTNTPTSPPGPAATNTNEQVYIDPAGWYAVNLPNEWQVSDNPNSLMGEDGFFKTGYLPEMMFMRHALDVSQWFANIGTKDTYSVALMSEYNRCGLTSLSDVTPPTVQAIIENPSADWPQRFLYIETDPAHFDEIMSTFAWLQPVDQRAEPAFHTATLRPEDISFWEDTVPPPVGFSIDEYVLPENAQDESPSEKVFLHYIPSDAPQEVRKPGTPWIPANWEGTSKEISHFGYELKPASHDHYYQLYKDDVLALDNIYKLPSVHHFSTSEGERIAFIARTVKDPDKSFFVLDNAVSYLVQNDSIVKWEDGPGDPRDPEKPPILVEDELLWMQVDENIHVHVINTQHDLLFSFATYYGASLPVRQFTAWNDHWILEVSDFVIQDGEILNEKFGFEEIFDWHSINDKPFYFFRKGPRIGISYDGQFLPVYYHEVAHGYG